MGRKSIKFKYNRQTRKGFLISNGKKIKINSDSLPCSLPQSSGGSGYGLHIIWEDA